MCKTTFVPYFPQTWFWISTSCQAQWVRTRGGGSGRPCSNSTTTKTTRSWPTAFPSYAPLQISAKSSPSLTPWTKMVNRVIFCFGNCKYEYVSYCLYLCMFHSNVMFVLSICDSWFYCCLMAWPRRVCCALCVHPSITFQLLQEPHDCR